MDNDLNHIASSLLGIHDNDSQMDLGELQDVLGGGTVKFKTAKKKGIKSTDLLIDIQQYPESLIAVVAKVIKRYLEVRVLVLDLEKAFIEEQMVMAFVGKVTGGGDGAEDVHGNGE